MTAQIGWLRLAVPVPRYGSVSGWRCWDCGTVVVVARGKPAPCYCSRHR